jgi:hypothetical protein
MPPEDSAQSELASREDALEQAIDAIVYDVHPALVSRPAYPYAAPSGASQAGAPHQPTIFDVLTGIAGDGLLGVFHHFAREPDYVVPQRFGLSAILGIMTVVAMLFGGLHWFDAWPVFYLFFGVLVIAICLVQMFSGRAPRLASTVAGMLFLPAFVVLAALFDPHFGREDYLILVGIAMGCIPVGALLGYLTGTCAAGIFLVMDVLEPYLQGQRPAAGRAASSSSATGA